MKLFSTIIGMFYCLLIQRNVDLEIFHLSHFTFVPQFLLTSLDIGATLVQWIEYLYVTFASLWIAHVKNLVLSCWWWLLVLSPYVGPAKGKQKLIINKAGLPSISFLMIFYSLLCFGMNSFDFVSQKKLVQGSRCFTGTFWIMQGRRGTVLFYFQVTFCQYHYGFWHFCFRKGMTLGKSMRGSARGWETRTSEEMMNSL